jgi:hypothetical protein
MKLLFIAALAALVALPLAAQSTTTTLTITIVSPPSTSIACGSTTSYTFTVPVTAGQLVCPITVQPGAWTGAFGLSQTSGPQANAFAISGNNLVVGATGITQPGAYGLTISASP